MLRKYSSSFIRNIGFQSRLIVSSPWKFRHWLVSDEQRRADGVTVETIFKEFKSSPNKLCRRLMFVPPMSVNELNYYIDSAEILFQANKPSKAIKLWEKAANGNCAPKENMYLAGFSLIHGAFEWARYGFSTTLAKAREFNLSDDDQAFIYNNLAITLIMDGIKQIRNEEQFSMCQEQSLKAFKDAMKFRPSDKIIQLNSEITKLLKPGLHFGLPYRNLTVRYQFSVTEIFDVITKDLEKYASVSETTSDISPIMSYGNSGPNLGLAMTSATHTKIHGNNLRVLNQLDNMKRDFDQRNSEKKGLNSARFFAESKNENNQHTKQSEPSIDGGAVRENNGSEPSGTVVFRIVA